jgi:LDH2 family malate/lactate/ureidoglycolate dehydrogenase
MRSVRLPPGEHVSAQGALPSRLRLSVAEARELAQGALRGIGYSDEEARIIADHVIDAAMCGYEYSGLAKVLNIPESAHFRAPRRPMRVLCESEVSLAFDGGNNVGMLALYHAAQSTIAKAAAHGIALVTVTNAWMSGRSAYYVELIARHGLVAMHTVGSSPLVAPPGGARSALGTNPIAIAVPSGDGPVVLDMGTSAYMMTEVMLRERLGELLPDGVALGPGGEPTRDPAAARRGALLPFGGYKGFALALMMQALGLLGTTATDGASEYGYLFIAFRADLFGPAEAFPHRVSELLARVKATPRRPGVAEIRLPSERAFRCRERARSEGLEIDRLVFDALSDLRARAGRGQAAPRESPGREA